VDRGTPCPSETVHWAERLAFWVAVFMGGTSSCGSKCARATAQDFYLEDVLRLVRYAPPPDEVRPRSGGACDQVTDEPKARKAGAVGFCPHLA
jgi:hypothetical protein